MGNDALPAGMPATKVVAGPRAVNHAGDIFGGWLMSQVDIAGAIRAIERARGRVATRAVSEFQFLRPVKVGDVVSCYAEVAKIGRTSVTVDIVTYVDRRDPVDFETISLKVAQARLVYVALDPQGKPRTVPPAE